MDKKIKVASELSLLFGITLVALSTSFFAKASFGISPLLSLPYVLAALLPSLTYGMWSILFQIALVAALCVVTRRMRMGYIASFALSALFGVLSDLFLFLFAFLPDTLPFRICWFVVGFALLSVGVAFSLTARLPLMPFDTFPRDLSVHLKVRFGTVKTAFDLTTAIIGLVLGFVFLGGLVGIGVGTAVCALLLGTTINKIRDALLKRMDFVPWFGVLEKIAK